MSVLAARYKIPQELMDYVVDGFMEVVQEDDPHKTIEFHIPSRRQRDIHGRITSYSLIWIHPDFNTQFCQRYFERPGDAPNFHLIKDTSDLGEDEIELNTVNELVDWLTALRATDVA